MSNHAFTCNEALEGPLGSKYSYFDSTVCSIIITSLDKNDAVNIEFYDVKIKFGIGSHSWSSLKVEPYSAIFKYDQDALEKSEFSSDSHNAAMNAFMALVYYFGTLEYGIDYGYIPDIKPTLTKGN
ncbi:MAG: hypothetical protein WC783_00820 [Candidatus Paceibacterota bacterium]|jgi:hypothetical protein